jgi:signal transduction histidine kinase
VVDITAELRADDSTSAARLRAELDAWRDVVASHEAVLGTMPEGIVLFDGRPLGRLRYANSASVRLLGGRFPTIDDLEPSELRDAVGRVSTGSPSIELTFDVGGRDIEAHVSRTHRPRATLVVARDVTAARHTERLRRNFVANASHELKTPVASILGLASALERAVGDDEATRRFVAMVGREADRLSALVSDLLDLSRLESDAGPAEAVAFSRLLLERCDKMRPDAEQADIRLQVECDADVEVLGRASDLGQMVDNLLSNAIRYTPAGVVRVRLARRHGDAVVMVADTGIGIPESDIGRVFERFYRVDPARDRATGGTGLGLAIVRHVAETHRGDVAVRSRVDAGSAFRVRLPLLDPRAQVGG